MILKIFFLIIKTNNNRGDLSSISAKTATLLNTKAKIETNAFEFVIVSNVKETMSGKVIVASSIFLGQTCIGITSFEC